MNTLLVNFATISSKPDMGELGGRHENVVCSTVMFVCQFCATLLPTAPYLLHDPFVADPLFA